mmetsp:Transcript_26713/g.41100  ORF Transcript_26713/g.41100 Transcript_26713/m.41100 type:complete len:100 (+) Transcript_26713:195-494(+)
MSGQKQTTINTPGVVNMELKKWYMDDGKGTVKTISSELKEKKTEEREKVREYEQIQNLPKESVKDKPPRKIECTNANITLKTLEPVWSPEEPRNCFDPF